MSRQQSSVLPRSEPLGCRPSGWLSLVGVLSGVLVGVLVVSAPVHGQISGKVERMGRGFGGKTTVLGAAYAELGRVTVKTKSVGFCAVTASFTGTLDQDELVDVSIAESPDAVGPWVQSYENEGGEPRSFSGLMVQTFDSPRNTAKKFYVNARSRSGEEVSVELTRVWAVCGRGEAQGVDGEAPPEAQFSQTP